MTIKVIPDGATEEIEVYTAEEVQAQIAAEKTKIESEFGKTKAQIEAERDEARRELGDRASEFKQFRKLTDETLAKLSVAERTLYENQLAHEQEREKRQNEEKATQERTIDSMIKEKVGGDVKLFEETKKMFGLIGIVAITPDEIKKKIDASLGALGQTQPDLVASINGFSAGSFEPPKPPSTDEKTFADSYRGMAAMKELGLDSLIPKTDKK